MNQDCLGSAPSKPPRNVRFAPKAPPRRDQKPILPKAEKVEDTDTAQEELMKRLYNVLVPFHFVNPFVPILLTHDSQLMLVAPSLLFTAAHTQVTFGFGGASSMRSYGPTKGGINRSQGGGASFKDMNEYKEPWVELLDEVEFCEASETTSYTENSTNAAEELGLMEDNLEACMLFLKLPETMPLLKQPIKTEDQEVAGSSKPLKGAGSSTKTCSLNELPPGYMGKKFLLAWTLFAQDAVAINKEEKHCCVLGELNKRATMIPDVDYAFANMPEL
ncbi:hypothetical protein LguiB_011917 [Lonicera macranthoides]